MLNDLRHRLGRQQMNRPEDHCGQGQFIGRSAEATAQSWLEQHAAHNTRQGQATEDMNGQVQGVISPHVVPAEGIDVGAYRESGVPPQLWRISDALAASPVVINPNPRYVAVNKQEVGAV